MTLDNIRTKAALLNGRIRELRGNPHPNYDWVATDTKHQSSIWYKTPAEALASLVEYRARGSVITTDVYSGQTKKWDEESELI